MNPLTAIEILRAARDRSSRETVRTNEVRQALTSLKAHMRQRDRLDYFWDSAGTDNDIGRSQNVRAALNGILRQLGLPME